MASTLRFGSEETTGRWGAICLGRSKQTKIAFLWVFTLVLHVGVIFHEGNLVT